MGHPVWVCMLCLRQRVCAVFRTATRCTISKRLWSNTHEQTRRRLHDGSGGGGARLRDRGTCRRQTSLGRPLRGGRTTRRVVDDRRARAHHVSAPSRRDRHDDINISPGPSCTIIQLSLVAAAARGPSRRTGICTYFTISRGPPGSRRRRPAISIYRPALGIITAVKYNSPGQ